MRKNILMIGALALAFAGTSAKAAEAVRGDLTVLVQPKMTNQGDNWGTLFYVSSAFKIDNSWSIVPEFLASLGITKDGKSASSLEVGYLRIVFAGPKLKNFGEGNDFSIDYRYTLPVDLGSQTAGSLGTIKVRPKLSWKFSEKFSALVRSGVSVALQRNGYAIHQSTMKPNSNPAGNTLAAWDMEIFPGYKVSENFTIGGFFSPIISIVGPAKGSDKNTYGKILYHEYNVQFAAAGLNFMPSIGHKSDFADFKLFTAKGLYYYVDVVKKF
jgi:hypothetical protein